MNIRYNGIAPSNLIYDWDWNCQYYVSMGPSYFIYMYSFHEWMFVSELLTDIKFIYFTNFTNICIPVVQILLPWQPYTPKVNEFTCLVY